MDRSGEPPSLGALKVAVVYNTDFQTLEESQNEDEPPSLEANAEVAVTAQRIASILNACGCETVAVQVQQSPAELSPILAELKADAVFNLVESLSNDATREPEVPALLERLRIPYTGNGPNVLHLAQDKAKVKSLLEAHCIPVAPGWSISRMKDFPKAAELKGQYPLFVKPARADASIGIDQNSVVYNRKQLLNRVERLLDHIDGPVIVEAYLPGREFNVALFPNPFTGAAVATEIDFSCYPDGYAPIVTYNCKWTPESPEYLARSRPAADTTSPALLVDVQRTARAAFLALGGNGYARVDIRLDSHGRPRVIDVNPNPDLDPEAGFAIAARSVGIDYSELVLLLTREASLKEGHVPAPYTTARPRSVSAFSTPY
ncbi:MAG: hypothetical protein C4523_05060 [Myxococcales bacterium]|nr:MAG: hypothetical protein C4523_05060 [Myxococcales bacterium]